MILFLGQLPPPIHGASVMNARAWNAILENFPSSIAINISNASSLDDIGSASIRKIFRIFVLYLRIIFTLLTKKPRICYFALCPSGAAFYRDAIIIGILKIFRVRRIIHLHGRGLSDATVPLRNIIAQFAISNSDVIHLSDILWGEVGQFTSRDKFWVVPNCAEDLSQCINFEFTDRTVNFFYFSNFIRGKGPLYLLQAAKILYEQKVRCKISLAGGWSDLGLKNEIEKWKNENRHIIDSEFVTFYGPRHGKEKIEFIKDGDVLVFPSYIDTFPLVVIEALSAGKAVIASTTGAVPEILEGGKYGLVFPEHNVSELVECMIALANDPALIREFGISGRARYESLYQEKAFECNLLKVINKIISSAA